MQVDHGPGPVISFDDEVVHPDLQKKLTWRVRKVGDMPLMMIHLANIHLYMAPLHVHTDRFRMNRSYLSRIFRHWKSRFGPQHFFSISDNARHLPTFEHDRGITAGPLGGCPAEISKAE